MQVKRANYSPVVGGANSCHVQTKARWRGRGRGRGRGCGRDCGRCEVSGREQAHEKSGRFPVPVRCGGSQWLLGARSEKSGLSPRHKAGIEFTECLLVPKQKRGLRRQQESPSLEAFGSSLHGTAGVQSARWTVSGLTSGARAGEQLQWWVC